MTTRYMITPVSKPRQTRSDKWNVRTCVARYRAFADECRLRGVKLNESKWITFGIPMPKSWSKNKRESMNGQPHRQKPDIDNLAKALFDAVYDDDAFIHMLMCRKVWSEEGFIEVGGS